MTTTAEQLAAWAADYRPTAADRDLARRALQDTVAVTLAATDSRMASLTVGLPAAARWSAVGHVLDFDDLHLPSTAHISVVCVPAALAVGGDERAYLAGAGGMARLTTRLGRQHDAHWRDSNSTACPSAAAARAGL